MSEREVALDRRMIAFVLPSIPESVRLARFHLRAALTFQRLGEYADDAGTIASDLVTNAIQHVADDPAQTIGVILARVWYPQALAVIVSHSSPQGPIKRKTTATSERGRGLHIVEALSAHWGCHPEPAGKVVFAVIAREV